MTWATLVNRQTHRQIVFDRLIVLTIIITSITQVNFWFHVHCQQQLGNVAAIAYITTCAIPQIWDGLLVYIQIQIQVYYKTLRNVVDTMSSGIFTMKRVL